MALGIRAPEPGEMEIAYGRRAGKIKLAQDLIERYGASMPEDEILHLLEVIDPEPVGNKTYTAEEMRQIYLYRKNIIDTMNQRSPLLKAMYGT